MIKFLLIYAEYLDFFDIVWYGIHACEYLLRALYNAISFKFLCAQEAILRPELAFKVYLSSVDLLDFCLELFMEGQMVLAELLRTHCILVFYLV